MEVSRGPNSVTSEVTDDEKGWCTVSFSLPKKMLQSWSVYTYNFSGEHKKLAEKIQQAFSKVKGNDVVKVQTKPVQVTVEEMTLVLDPQEVKCLNYLLEQFEENCYMGEDEGGPEGGEAFKDKLIEEVQASISRAAKNKSHPN